MCTLTHFAYATRQPSTLYSTLFSPTSFPTEGPALPRFQVVLAGNSFFTSRKSPLAM